MSHVSASSTAAVGAAAAASSQAVKASGAIVRVDPPVFLDLLAKGQDQLVIHAKGGLFGGNHRYLANYKGMVFFAQAAQPLEIPEGVEIFEAGRIWVPS